MASKTYEYEQGKIMLRKIPPHKDHKVILKARTGEERILYFSSYKKAREEFDKYVKSAQNNKRFKILVDPHPGVY